MDFVKSAILSNLRLDGRKLDEQYDLNVILNISSIAHGSSQVTFGDNVVQTTVNFSITTPGDSTPDEGMIEMTICGTGVFENQELVQRNDNFLCNILYDFQFQHNFFDLKSLCILPGQFCWNLRIHSTVIKRGGSLLDALSIGVLTAFSCSEVPSVDVMIQDEMESSKNISNLQIKLSTEKNKFLELLVNTLPVVTTVGKVGDNYVWCLTKDEEQCCDGTLSVAVDRSGRCVSVKAKGSFFDLNSIDPLISKCSQLALDNFKRVNQFFK